MEKDIYFTILNKFYLMQKFTEWIFPNMQLMLLIPPVPIKAKYLVLVYGFYEIWSEFNRMPGDNVAHLAHLGGMLIAYIILRYWKNKYGTYY